MIQNTYVDSKYFDGTDLDEGRVSGEADEEEHVHPVVQEVDPVVSDLLNGAPDLVRDACNANVSCQYPPLSLVSPVSSGLRVWSAISRG